MKERVAECNLGFHTIITFQKPWNETDEVALIACTNLTVSCEVHWAQSERGGQREKFISGGVLKIRICIFSPDPTAIPKVHSRAGSQWRWEEAFSKGGSHSAHPAASHKGKRLSIPKQWEQFPAPRIYHTEAQNSNVLSFVSMKKGFWRKYAEKFATSSRPRRAEKRKRSTSMGWKAGNIQI